MLFYSRCFNYFNIILTEQNREVAVCHFLKGSFDLQLRTVIFSKNSYVDTVCFNVIRLLLKKRFKVLAIILSDGVPKKHHISCFQ